VRGADAVCNTSSSSSSSIISSSNSPSIDHTEKTQASGKQPGLNLQREGAAIRIVVARWAGIVCVVGVNLAEVESRLSERRQDLQQQQLTFI
jgi:hypothetical protein